MPPFLASGMVVMVFLAMGVTFRNSRRTAAGANAAGGAAAAGT